MNSVYYIFLVIVIISFITGLIITFIDNSRGEVLDGEFVSKKKSTDDDIRMIAPIRTNSFENQGASMVAVNNSVPYLPINTSNAVIPPIIYEESMSNGVSTSPVIQQPVITSVQPVMQQQVVQPYLQQPVIQQPVMQPILQQPVIQQPVITAQSMLPQNVVNSVSPSNTNQNLQINSNDANKNFFNVPVLVPMSMDDGSL